MILDTECLCKFSSVNLYDVENYPHWLEVGSVIAYGRTSPDQSGEQRTGDYQPAAIERFASERGLNIAKIYPGIGERGRRIGPGTTPQLIAAIEHAKRTGFPIVAFDWQRFSREPHKLARYPVHFVSLVPLAVDAAELPGIRKRASNQHDSSGKGGRPRDSQAPFALPFILSQLGKPWSQIARELGAGWSDNKARRVLLEHFVYVDSTKLPAQGGSPAVAE